jgi:hypothetical protein
MTETLAGGAETSVRERVFAALHAIIAQAMALRVPAPYVMREEPTPQTVPPGGLVIIADGGVIEQTALMSPLTWQVEHEIGVTIVLGAVHVERRAAQLDALVRDVIAAVVSDRTLGGAAVWTQPGAWEYAAPEIEGSEPLSAARLPIVVTYLAAETPSS